MANRFLTFSDHEFSHYILVTGSLDSTSIFITLSFIMFYINFFIDVPFSFQEISPCGVLSSASWHHIFKAEISSTSFYKRAKGRH